MTEFTELDLSKPVEEMEADEARETLTDFMEAHRSNQDAYDAVQSEVDEIEAEYSEQIEDYEKMLTEFREDKAEEAAEHVNMPADLLADRFEYSELEQIIEDGEEFSEEPEDDEGDEEETSLTTFSDKPQKGRKEDTNGTERYRDEAASALSSHGFPTN